MYSTIEDLINMFGENEIIEISSVPNVDGLNEEKCYRCLEQATAEIDSYIGMKVAVPLVNYIPDVINRICCNIARYRLYDDKKTPNVQKEYDNEIAFLKDFRNGLVYINFENPNSTDADGNPIVNQAKDEVKIKVKAFESSVFSNIF